MIKLFENEFIVCSVRARSMYVRACVRACSMCVRACVRARDKGEAMTGVLAHKFVFMVKSLYSFRSKSPARLGPARPGPGAEVPDFMWRKL